MTEGEWLAGTDPAPMLAFLRGRASDRKLRLFAVACCRRIWHLLVAEVEVWHRDEAAFWHRCQEAVLLAEQFADGKATAEQLAAATAYPRPGLYDADAAMFSAEIPLDPSLVAGEAAEAAAQEAAGRVYGTLFPEGYRPESKELMIEAARRQEQEYDRVLALEKRAQCDLLRDLFGNPFRHVSIDPRWLAPQAVSLAQHIYDARAFEQLSLLADALQGAGCDDADILNHCRQPGEHVRGCWVVDWLLGKNGLTTVTAI